MRRAGRGVQEGPEGSGRGGPYAPAAAAGGGRVGPTRPTQAARFNGPGAARCYRLSAPSSTRARNAPLGGVCICPGGVPWLGLGPVCPLASTC